MRAPVRGRERAVIVATALDVAVEFVATKIALLQVLDGLFGSEPSAPSEALHHWSHESPVQILDEDGWLEEGFSERLYARADEIETEMIAAVGAFLTARAERLIELRSHEVTA
jgi:hypothetical protein